MQGPDSTDSPETPPQEDTETLKLRAELSRLREKRQQAEDPDIAAVLDMRISELESTLEGLDAVNGAPELEQPEPEEPEEIQKLRTELAKLKDKLSKTKDSNIISVLQMRIGQIEPTLPPPPRPKPTLKAKVDLPRSEEEEFAKIPLPSPAQSEAAEKLIRQARLEKQRGNVVGATDLLKKAVEAAPGSPVVLEALGDDLAERKLIKQALETYKRALRLDPKNVGIERKHALMALRTTSFGMTDSIFLTGQDNVAGLTAAKFLSAFFPGVGQMVIGRTVKGGILFACYVLCFGLLVLMRKDFELLMHVLVPSNHSSPGSPKWLVLVPILGAIAVWLTSMGDLFSGQSQTVARHTKVDRPKPPVDLPFD